MLKQKKASCLHDTDRLARKLWSNLLRDFRASEGIEFCRKADQAFATGLDVFRSCGTFPELGVIPVGRFKRYAQLESLFQKYRFAKDVYTDDQLHKLTLDKYFLEQERLAKHRYDGPLVHTVVQRARVIAKRILGDFVPQDVVLASRFGRKSSIGCPLSLAYIDHKLTDVKAITGSSECVKWFKEQVLPGDPILSALMAEAPVDWSSESLAHESLALVNVPKSWKTYRTITPLTLISLFYSYGVGAQVTERLKQAGLDISTLQSRHRKLVERFSRDMSHATADLSAASDSLTTGLLNRILPRPWYNAVKKTFTHKVSYMDASGESVFAYTESVLPMGNGCTFPVETLIFYSIIKAIGELSDVKGIYSVYGDDLIYPSRLHKYVRGIFPRLGLVLNLGKTFVSHPFRESCGADFYRGCDVRPFFLRGERQQLTSSQYTAFLYKVYNGLTRRWDPLEIPSTLYMLLLELAQVSGEIFRVPQGFPDTAGIKTDDPSVVPLDVWALPWSPVHVCFTHGSRWFRFRFLTATSERRFIKSIHPYYWLSLQNLTDDLPKDNFWETDYSMFSQAPRQNITWKKEKVTQWYNRNGVKLQKVKVKYSPQSTSRIASGLAHESGSISDWI